MNRQILISCFLVLCLNQISWADNKADDANKNNEKESTEDWIMDTSEIGKTSNGIVRNDQVLELGVPTASSLQLEGESSLQMGNLDQALVTLQRAIELAPMDADKRILYAEALEKKLMGQKNRDPRLYNFVVKQWLFVEKHSDFPDQKVMGGTHLHTLTGSVPKFWERPDQYLQKVLLPEDSSVPVTIGGVKIKKEVASKDKEEME